MLWKAAQELLRKKVQSGTAQVKKVLKCFLDHANGGEEQFISSLETGGCLGPAFRNTLFMGKRRTASD